VDNASSDATPQIAKELMAQYPNIRYVLETNLGLSRARNRGWQEAQGQYVAYLDDDAKVPPHWLKKALEIIALQSPLAFGGPFYPFYLTPKPDWYKDEYGSYVKATQACFTDNEAFLTGGNMCIRREVFIQQQGFPVELGMNGTQLSYAEETFLFRHLVNQYGKCLYFDPEFFIYHLVRPEKMRLSYAAYVFFASGRDYYSAVLANTYNEGKLIYKYKAILLFFRQILLLLGHLILFPFRDKQKVIYIQQYIYEVIYQDFFLLSVWYSSIKSLFLQPERLNGK
jgi:glucosyl-dolichyl phosphate glucuronosyltransferase